MGRIFGYQQGLSLLLGLVSGLVFFDRGAINFLSPFIVAELKLTNAELGMASSAVALTWAAASCLVGRRSDRSGRRKPYLIAATIAFPFAPWHRAWPAVFWASFSRAWRWGRQRDRW